MCFFGEQGKQILGDPDMGVPASTRDKGDRELAYLVCEMFQALDDGVVCVLPTNEALGLAAREWQKGQLRTRLVSSPSALIETTGSKGGGGFSAQSTGEASAGAIRVVVVVRANKQRLSQLAPLIDPLGNEVVVVLVNPTRLKSGGVRKGYTPAFVLRDNPHPEWRGGLLYRRYPERWLLGVAGSRGRVVVRAPHPRASRH